MEYRTLPRGNEKISIIGLGNSSLGAAGEEETEKTVVLALENGINYFDMASADEFPFDAFGRAVSGWRDQVYFQVHFGAEYSTGKYGWTTDLDTVKRSVEWQLSALRTDYIDVLLIHRMDALVAPEEVAEGIVAVTKEAVIAFPDSRILLLGLLPAGKEKGSAIRMSCDKIHAILKKKKLAGAEYVNPTEWFLDADGRIRDELYSGDYTHLTEEGYKLMADKIMKALLEQG